MKLSSILGLNARFQHFSYPSNSRRAKKNAVSKLAAKKALEARGIPVPKTYVKFVTLERVYSYAWARLPDSFALKPSRGLGGEGIIVIKKRSRESTPENPIWLTIQKKRVTVEDLKLHAIDIIEGAYSAGNVPDTAFAEEYVGRHKAFRRLAYRGTPDIRLIVFNKVPVMAMLRLPTKESGGRANLHQGALGVGVDIATGITTHAIHNGEFIHFKPGTKRKLHGIKIPEWNSILELAVRAQEASELGYVGVDIVLHPEKGPMVLELNAQPGLMIQLANKAGLRKRLERVEDLVVRDGEHGVKIAKALFASPFADKVRAEEGIKTISTIEEIKIRTKNRKKVRVLAKVDTGAWRTSINRDVAEKLGLLGPENVLWTKRVRSAMGTEERPIVSLTFWLAGRKVQTPVSIASRNSLRYPVIIGRKDLKGFLVDPLIAKDKKQ